MFDHRNFATHGLYPGLVSTFSVAVLGHLELEIQIEELRSGGHSGAVPYDRDEKQPKKYKIKVTVRHKNRMWTKERTVSEVTAKVIASLTGVKIPAVETQVNVTTVLNTTNKVTVDLGAKQK